MQNRTDSDYENSDDEIDRFMNDDDFTPQNYNNGVINSVNSRTFDKKEETIFSRTLKSITFKFLTDYYIIIVIIMIIIVISTVIIVPSIVLTQNKVMEHLDKKYKRRVV